jgi:hypothetical protein
VAFAAALVLAAGSGARGSLALAPGAGSPGPDPLPEGLLALRDGNPAARGLPLLAALAEGARREVRLPMADGAVLRVAVAP